MTTWLKNILYKPVQYGLEGANFLATKVISIILNMYGNKLLKTNNDQIIEKNECIGDRNIFYFYPLQLKPLEQDARLNLVKINNGIISGLVISVPWKSLLTEPTYLTVEHIKLGITIVQNTEKNLNTSENTNSYFQLNQTKIVENENLLDMFHEINNLLKQYFNTVYTEIKTIELLVENLQVIVDNILYQNGTIKIDKIKVVDTNGKILLDLSKISYAFEQNLLTTEEVQLMSKIIEFMPTFYVDNSKTNFQINLSINSLKMDKLSAKSIHIGMMSDIILIKNLSNLIIDDLMIFHENPHFDNNLLIFDDNVMLFEKSFYLKIGDTELLTAWFKEFRELIAAGTKKIINVEKTFNDENKKFHIKNINSRIIYGDDLFELIIDDITISEHQILSKVKLVHNQVMAVFDNILIVENGGIVLCKSMLLSKDFGIVADEVKIIRYENNMDIYFNYAKVKNLILIIDFVTNMINKFSKVDNDNDQQLDLSTSISNLATSLDKMNNEKLIVNLHIIESDISINYENINFDIVITHTTYNINEQCAIQSVAGIMMNGHLILKFNAEKLSKNDITINNLQVFLDPKLFDKLNYFFGTLTPESEDELVEDEISINEEGLKQLRAAFSNSMISYHIQDMEQILKNKTSKIIDVHQKEYQDNSILNIPTIKLLTVSFANLRTAINPPKNIPEEQSDEQKMTIVLHSCHIYLFDKLLLHDNNRNAFIIVTIKNILLEKTEEDTIEPIRAPIVIREPGLRPLPKRKVKYWLKVGTGAIIDIGCHDPDWRYFAKFSDHNILELAASIQGDRVNVNIMTTPICANIREETLVRLLAFFSNSHHTPKNSKQVIVENFTINDIYIVLNFYPLILKQVGIGSNIFTLKNLDIKLSGQNISYVDGFGNLLTIIGTKWKEEVNPDNLMQFIPNLKIIQPYAVPIVNLWHLISEYFKRAENKKKIRAITRNLNHGADMLSALIKHGINHVHEFFKQ